ncbi:MAG: hypothetical protein WBD34_10220 [Burkholderiaceae bacterium]
MAYEVLSLESVVDIVLDTVSPIYRFKGRNARYRAFEIAPPGHDMSLLFESEVKTDWVRSPSVFRPGVLFLNEKKVAIESRTPTLFNQRFKLLGKNKFIGRVRIPPTARYAVVYPESDRAFVTGELRPVGFDGAVNSAQTGHTRMIVTADRVATIEDTIESESDSRIRVYAVTAIEGESVPNARGATSGANYGMGFQFFRTQTRTRELPARMLTISVIGTHQMGAPIHEMAARVAGTFYQVDGSLKFEPKAWTRYKVRGRLTKSESTVWIERASDGVKVTSTISSRSRDSGSQQPRDVGLSQ